MKFAISTRKSKNAEGVWVSKCPDLGIVTQGTSPDEARAALKEAAGFILSARMDDGISASARILTVPYVLEDAAGAAGLHYASA